MSQVNKYIVNGEIEQARALSGFCVCASEQVALDKGDWSLAMLLTLQPEPPFAYISSRKSDTEQMEPHSQLADERWIEAHLAYLADTDKIIERREKVIKTRHGGKQKGKGKGDKEKKEE